MEEKEYYKKEVERFYLLFHTNCPFPFVHLCEVIIGSEVILAPAQLLLLIPVLQ